jgi:hypothetical protein
MKVLRERTTIPAGLPGDSPANYQDGGYWALLAQ